MPGGDFQPLQGTVGKQAISNNYVLHNTIGLGNFGKVGGLLRSGCELSMSRRRGGSCCCLPLLLADGN